MEAFVQQDGDTRTPDLRFLLGDVFEFFNISHLNSSDFQCTLKSLVTIVTNSETTTRVVVNANTNCSIAAVRLHCNSYHSSVHCLIQLLVGIAAGTGSHMFLLFVLSEINQGRNGKLLCMWCAHGFTHLNQRSKSEKLSKTCTCYEYYRQLNQEHLSAENELFTLKDQLSFPHEPHMKIIEFLILRGGVGLDRCSSCSSLTRDTLYHLGINYPPC
jgi:hypothetical protein